MKELPRRLHSIDVFRAVTMFLMIFVNDVDGVKNIPDWIKHVSADTDGLGFADTIFPAFLFIVGLSLPLALRNRINKGFSTYNVAAYIISRSFALLVMGFLQVNLEHYNASAVLPKAVWEILITLSFFLIWLDYDKDMRKQRIYIYKGSGIVLLIVMVFLFKGGKPGESAPLQPYWWGILGLIGWSYLICASVFLLSKGRLLVQVIAFLFFLFFNVAVHAHWLTAIKTHSYLWIVGDAAMPALTMAGVVISVTYTELVKLGKQKQFWFVLLLASIALFAFAFAIRPVGGISKIHATPSWVGICSAISIVIFGLIIYLVDVKERQNWFGSIRTAGTSTLTCYLIPYFLYSIYSLFHIRFPSFLSEGAGGIVRSILTAFLVIFIAGLLERKRIRLSV